MHLRKKRTDLATLLLERAPIAHWAADCALCEFAASNNRDLVALLCSKEGLCSERGKQEAALAAVNHNSIDSILEMLNRGAIGGIYTHPMDSALDHLLGTPLEESIWTVLLRNAVQNGALEIAEAVAIATPHELTLNDLQWLGSGEVRSGKQERLKEIMDALPQAQCSRSELQFKPRTFWV